MTTRIGMNTTVASGVVSSISGQAMGLEGIEQEVTAARLTSMNPLAYALSPGSLILAPFSITIAASAAADLANVRASLSYLVQTLSQEISQQQATSNSLSSADPGWFPSRVGPSGTAPDDIGIFERELEIINTIANAGNLILLARDGIEAAKTWLKLHPKIMDVAEIVLKGGKFIPIAGVLFSAISLAVEWDSENVWGNWRNGIGLALDGASVVAAVMLVPPLTPVGAVLSGVLLGVGIAWDITDILWDKHDEGKWAWPWE